VIGRAARGASAGARGRLLASLVAVVAVLTVIYGWMGAAPASATSLTYTYDASAHSYDGSAGLSSPHATAVAARGSPAGIGVASPERSAAASGFGYAVVVVVLGAAQASSAPAESAHSLPASTYNAPACTYDVPMRLSIAYAAATEARGSPAGPGAVSWGTSVAAGEAVLAANTAGGASSGTGRVFVGTSRGTVYDIPEGWAGRAANNNRGIVYQRAGAEGNADMVRIMEPTPKHPDGYVRVYNSVGQPVDVFGRPGPPGDTHIPGSYSGPWPGWPQ
jgi:hypothetical protein